MGTPTQTTNETEPLLPSQVDPGLHWFDRFATSVSTLTAKAWTFLACLGLVLLWAVSYWFAPNSTAWQLWINTPTTVITFLMVFLIQNTQKRSDNALQRKLNALDAAVANLIDHQVADSALAADVAELRQAVGLEVREGS